MSKTLVTLFFFGIQTLSLGIEKQQPTIQSEYDGLVRVELQVPKPPQQPAQEPSCVDRFFNQAGARLIEAPSLCAIL